ncbi:MAG: LacI family transcriptional regulator [Firmicutes bacterium]|nr:LacI family transcriptional regulator [Bacillota bacterium]
MPVTISDIAKAANVTKATVSYVINNKPGVSEETRQKILKIMKEMNYHPNAVARGLAGKSTEMLGLIIPDISDHFYVQVVRGVEKTANLYNFTLNLCTTHAIPEKEQEMVDLFTNGRVDGIILMTYFLDLDYIINLKKRKIPFVLIDSTFDDKSIYSVNVDNFEAGYKATEYLIKLGHKRIAFVGGPQSSNDSLLRFRGYRQALNDYGLSYTEDLFCQGNFKREGGYQAFFTLQQIQPNPTAVFAANDQMAIGVLSAARAAGLKVPQELSIIGCDDIEASSLVEPALTTIKQPIEEMGKRATEMIFQLIYNEKPSQRKVVLKTSLVERSSCQAI